MKGPGGGNTPAPVTEKLRPADTAAKFALPACVARIVHMPSATSVTTLPLAVHTAGVCDENVTGRPEDAVACGRNCDCASVSSFGCKKKSVWMAGVTVKL